MAESRELEETNTEQSILDSLTAHVAVLDREGRIIRINAAWKTFAQENEAADLSRVGVGVNYLEVCRRSIDSGDELAAQAKHGLQEVLDGRRAEFSLEYPCHSASEDRWYLMSITPIRGARGGAVVSHQTITDRKKAEEALRQEQQLSESIINTARTIVLVLDSEGRIVRFNPYLEELTGWRLDEVRGRSWFDNFIPEDDRESIRRLFGRALSGERTRAKVNSIVTKDERICEIEWYDAPLMDARGKEIGLLCTGHDVTERLATERTIRESENRIRAIVNTAADAIITIDHAGIIQDVNPATEAIFGYSQEELVGQNVSMLMPKPYRDEHDFYLKRYLQTGEAHIIGSSREATARRKDGSIFPVDLAVSRVEHSNEFTGFIRDISIRKELQRQVLKIAEEEQRRIGQELHDGTGQELTGLALIAGTLASLLDEIPRKSTDGNATWLLDEASLMQLRQTSHRLSQGLSQANRHVQQLSHGIMPVQVAPEGLRSALEQLTNAIHGLQNIICHFDCPEPIEVANNSVATHLYRIAQEAVNNAVRHSRATHIRVSLLQVKNEIILEVSDNGIGFAPVATGQREAPGITRGFGLEIMNYRAAMIGGTFRISRRNDGGMLVQCVVPRERNRDN